MIMRRKTFGRLIALVAIVASLSTASPPEALARGRGKPRLAIEEATIAQLQSAILRRQITTTEIVNRYLDRIKAYNGTCVNQPQGILGPISTIPNAGQLNALVTLNLRPAARVAWGFDARKGRSQTDPVDDDPMMPDALETAAALDDHVSRTGRLVGPLHGVVMAIKDQYDTFDMRTTSGADAFWADDRPPDDATFVKQLRDAGAIILAKANMGEYAAGGITGTRSSFGGTICNAYDTERDPGASSGGSGVAVAANLVTCAIGEETGTSVREPAKNNNVVGIAPTRELVSADGMMERGLTTRVGPICRTVEDTARILDVYAGFDPNDELTAFSVGRKPTRPYQSFTGKRRLDGVRIGVVREYMDKSLFTVADAETIDIVDDAIGDLRSLGATIVDPGPSGALFQSCIDKVQPVWRNKLFTGQFPSAFPVDAAGVPTTDHIQTLVELFFNPIAVPKDAAGQPSIRNLGASPGDSGGSRYNWNVYLKERGDANIKTLTDLIVKANFWEDPAMPNRKASRCGEVPRHGRRAADPLHVAGGGVPVLRRAPARRGRLPDGQRAPRDPDGSAGAHGERSQLRPLDLRQQPRLSGADRSGRVHDGGLRPGCRGQPAAADSGEVAGRDRLPGSAVQRSEALRDRRGLRGGDASSDPTARIRPDRAERIADGRHGCAPAATDAARSDLPRGRAAGDRGGLSERDARSPRPASRGLRAVEPAAGRAPGRGGRRMRLHRTGGVASTNATTSSSTGATKRSGQAKAPINVVWLARS
jgi:Asp-tRNA(Asn)/Glu-tRNA(Gln) amidotransferase A subunit family amidase